MADPDSEVLHANSLMYLMLVSLGLILLCGVVAALAAMMGR
jgi:hypothetical protein